MEEKLAKRIMLPLDKNAVRNLVAGDRVLLTGYLYTARDAAHKRFYDEIINCDSPGLDISGATFYYAGPCPAKPGEIIGSVGPTTSCRMDKYTPLLLENGLLGMIGKGQRSEEVIESIKKTKSIYFGATGGAGALISRCVKSCEVVAFDDLGTEAVRRLFVEDFPVIVLIDSEGNNLYEIGRENFKKGNMSSLNN